MILSIILSSNMTVKIYLTQYDLKNRVTYRLHACICSTCSLLLCGNPHILF